jgi:hypothetical protein
LGDAQNRGLGAAVEAVFEDHPEGHTLVQWKVV